MMNAQYIPLAQQQLVTDGFGQPPTLPFDRAQDSNEYPLRRALNESAGYDLGKVPTQAGACHPLPLSAIENLNALRCNGEERARKAAEALVCMRRSFDACRLYELLCDLEVIL